MERRERLEKSRRFSTGHFTAVNVGHIAVNREKKKEKKFSMVSSVFMSAGREREREIYDFQRGGVIKSGVACGWISL